MSKSLNMPDVIDVIWLDCKLLQHIKYVLKTMTNWLNKHRETYQRRKVKKQTIVHIRKLEFPQQETHKNLI